MGKNMKRKHGIATEALHGSEFEKVFKKLTKTTQMPVCASANFTFESVEEGAEVFGGKKAGFFYGRFGTPNATVVEEKLAKLEKGEAARLFSSGMAAITTTFMALFAKGDEIISCQTMYGCTDDFLSHFFPQRFGGVVRFVDCSSAENIYDAITDRTRGIFIETPANPTLEVLDIRMIAKICKERSLLFLVDNTFAQPYNQKPLTMGADVVLHSATKYLNGHSDVVSGAVVSSKEIITKVSALASLLGPAVSAFDAFLFNRGLATYELRMERHNQNGLRLARFLEAHPLVAKVWYPGSFTSGTYTLAALQMKGFSGVMSFELKGDQKTAANFLNYLAKHTFVKLAVSLGSTTTMVQCPALMTHSGIPREERLKKGITDTMIRVSVGIENYEDIEAAFKEAFAHIKTRKGCAAQLRRSTEATKKAARRLSKIQKVGG
jgi:methionine-gamma-lyase